MEVSGSAVTRDVKVRILPYLGFELGLHPVLCVQETYRTIQALSHLARSQMKSFHALSGIEQKRLRSREDKHLCIKIHITTTIGSENTTAHSIRMLC